MKKVLTAAAAVAICTFSIYAMSTGLSRENFEKIKTGMSYSEVKEIIGRDGELRSESEVAEIKTKLYVWKAQKGDKADRGGSLTVIFQNDKVTLKSQFGLK